MFAISIQKASTANLRRRSFHLPILVGVTLASALAPAQYSIVSRADGWSQAWYNGPGHVGSYTHLASFGSPTASVNPNDNTGTAIAATTSVAGNGSDYPHNPNTFNIIHGSVNLASVSESFSEFDTGTDGVFTGNDGGTTSNQMDDSVTLTVAGANGSTQTQIGYTYTLAGHLNQSGSNPTADGEVLGSWSFGAVGSGLADAKLDVTSGYQAFVNGATGTGSFTTSSPSLFVQSGTFTITGTSFTGAFDMTLRSFANSGMDEGYSSHFEFTMPSNVSVSSSSGVFGTQPVPEPVSLLVLGSGLLALVRSRRLKR